MSKTLNGYFDEKAMEKIARQTGFVKRKNEEEKINGFNFVKLLLFQHEECEAISLLDLSIAYFNTFDQKISKQGIDARFTQKASDFFRLLLSELLEKVLSVEMGTRLEMKELSSVKIKDATSFQLPAQYAGTYPGSGGSASAAMIKIQYEYDLLSGKITHLSFHPFTVTDSTHAKNTLDQIEEKDLILRDMGYYFTDMLPVIEDKEAFYLSRLPCSITHIYEKKTNKEGEIYDEKMTFVKLLDQIEPEGKQITVYLTSKKIKSRLIIQKVPQYIYRQKLKEKKASLKKGQALSDENKARLWFNLYLTNLSKTISVRSIYELYRLRWQVELVFKTWKSFGSLASVKKMKQSRFECMLYIRLIWLVIQSSIIRCVQNISEQSNTPTAVSLMKLSKYLNKAANKSQVLEALINSQKRFIHFVENLLGMCPDYFVLERKKGSKSSAEIMKECLQEVA